MMKAFRYVNCFVAGLVLVLAVNACSAPTEPRIPEEKQEETDPNDDSDKPALLLPVEAAGLA